MSLLYAVLYAAHARGTHHKLALDALRRLDRPDTERWQRLFLKHAEPFMTGAKAPDDVFKDFKNHVLHPRDGYWGGAPAAARAWYEKTVVALKAADWPEAAYAAGVLSHYVTDPVQPFHTGQSEAESSIHRAFEWSTAKSYAALVAAAPAGAPVIAVPAGDDWLGEMLRAAAANSNRYYEKCLAHYDIKTGVVDPPAGLDDISRRIIGELILYAQALFAAVLGRALAEANVAPPEVSLGLDTVLATIKVPIKVVANQIADGRDRQVILAMYDELKATGTVEATLPEDERTVRDLHAAEVASQRPSPGHATSPASAATAVESVRREAAASAPSAPKLRLALSDPVVDAPSIGPKMAEGLERLAIRTVADLLAAEPGAVAGSLALSHVAARDIADWQAQTRLVLAVPGLTGTGAQLLVGAGYREPAAIASASAEKLTGDVQAFASGAAGRRVLRDGRAPGGDVIKAWAASTRAALAA